MRGTIKTVRLPDPQPLHAELRQRGFLLVRDLLDATERAALFDLAFALVQRLSRTIHRTGDAEGLWYDVVAGDCIEAEGAPLFGLYTDPDMLSWIRTLTASPSLGTSPHLRSAININCLRTAGQQYPWHRDAVPYTSVLFLSTVPPSAGGTFNIRAADGDLVDVQPTAGSLVFMDGTRCPHAVSPLTAETVRLTMPMVYPEQVIDRPAGLDEYLYGS